MTVKKPVMSGHQDIKMIKCLKLSWLSRGSEANIFIRVHHWLGGAGAALPVFTRKDVVILKTKSSLCNSFLLKMSNDQIIATSFIWNEEMTSFGWLSVKVRTCFLIISLTQEQEKVGLHTHTLTWDLIVGLNRFMRNAWSCD